MEVSARVLYELTKITMLILLWLAQLHVRVELANPTHIRSMEDFPPPVAMHIVSFNGLFSLPQLFNLVLHSLLATHSVAWSTTKYFINLM